MSKIVKVPVLPHTHQMMITFFGSNGKITFDKNSFIGTAMTLALEKIDYNLKPKTIPNGSIDLKFELPKSLQQYDLSDNTGINLGRFFDEFFRHSLAMFVAGAKLTIKNHQSCSTSFLEFAQVKDFIELDSAKKMSDRRVKSYMNKRRANKRKKNIKNLLPVVSV